MAIDEGVEAQFLEDARRALEQRRRLHLRYLCRAATSPPSATSTPMRVVNLDAHWYLEGWCHRAQDTRLFRMDRIERLQVLDQDGTPPPHAQLRDLDAGTFTARPEDQLVTLRLEPGATWVSDYYPVESVEEHEDGSQTVSLRTADTAWLRRLLWRLGGRGTLLEPKSLAAEVRRGAREALAAYEGPSVGPPRRGRVVARVVVGADLDAARRDRGGLPRRAHVGPVGQSRSSLPSSSGPPDALGPRGRGRASR